MSIEAHTIIDEKREIRRRRRNCVLFVISLMVAIGLAYAIGVEPHHAVVERVTLSLPRLPQAFDGFTIVQLSDVHFPDGHRPQYFADAVKRANALHPDLILLTGDYVTHSPEYAAPCGAILSRLRASHGVFAVLGNHDYWAGAVTLEQALASAGIRVLINESASIRRGTSRLWIAGVDDYWGGRADLPTALHGIPRDEVTILLAHEPDYAEVATQYPVDLQLSGHSHGGQVSLPLIGAPWTPSYSHKYKSGDYQVGRLRLHVNRGLGGIAPLGIPIRFNARPEITVITLQTAR